MGLLDHSDSLNLAMPLGLPPKAAPPPASPTASLPNSNSSVSISSTSTSASTGTSTTSTANPAAATSPDDLARPKRARTSRPKVKTGCNNCKQRRIKCDEKRPSCSNCVRSKKICTGYPPPSRSARPFEEILIAPKPTLSWPRPVPTAPAPAPRQMEKFKRREKVKQERGLAQRDSQALVLTRPAILVAPATSLPFTRQEELYFRLFQERTASELSGFFDNVFWSQGVLQGCYSDHAIRHAVIAIGALYRTLEKSCESPPTSPSARDLVSADTPRVHWEMAIEKYSHACKELSGPNSHITDRTRLMGSVLLACFDSFIGDHKQAIVQIQTGLGLLEQLRAQRRRTFLPKPEEPVEEELIQMFTRLAIQAKSYDMAFHFPHPYVIHLNDASRHSDPSSPQSDGSSPTSLHHDPIPGRFADAREARAAWDALQERIVRFTETMFSYVTKGPMGVLPLHLRRYGAEFKGQIEAWSRAYDCILASRDAFKVTHQEKAAILALKMSQVMGYILFAMIWSDDEIQFDAYSPQFREIISLAREVVDDEESRAAAKRCPDSRLCQHPHHKLRDTPEANGYAARHIKPSFSADLGIVPPLFVVATKCREPGIRRQAIQLLMSSSRREGMWDSELAARIGVWVSSVEEQGGFEIIDTATLPARVPSRQLVNDPPNLKYEQTPEPDGVPLRQGWNAAYGARGTSEVREQIRTIPAERRVMIKAVEFDLRERFATIKLGTRSVLPGHFDSKTQVKRIVW